MAGKVVVMIDGGYFGHLSFYLRKGRGKSLDVEKLSSKVSEGEQHIRTKFYHANPYQSRQPTDMEKKRFKNAQKFQYAVNRIKNHEYVGVGRVRPLPIHCPLCSGDYTLPKQKGVDVAIALDLVKMARKRVADVFVLISGDEDLASAVEMAQEELCNVIVYFASDSGYGIYGSSKLGNVASDRVRMDQDFLEKCAMD